MAIENILVSLLFCCIMCICTYIADMNEILRLAPGCVGDTLRRTARAISQRYDHALLEVGLNVGQFAILARLAGFEQQKVAPALGELAQAVGIDRTTLTRALRPLEREGMLRIDAGEDRRTRIVILKDRGRRRLDKALPLWHEAQESVLNLIGRDRWDLLRSELDTLSTAAS